MSTVLLARHGETTWNREGRVQGWAPTPLTDRGREGAADLGAAIADRYAVDRIVASDLRRTRETAERLGVDAPLALDERWRERDFGVYQGLTAADLDALVDEPVAETSANAIEARPESGEGMADLVERVVEAWEAVAGCGATTLVVTHGGPLYAALGHLKDVPMSRSVREHDPANCGLTEVADGTVVRENVPP